MRRSSTSPPNYGRDTRTRPGRGAANQMISPFLGSTSMRKSFVPLGLVAFLSACDANTSGSADSRAEAGGTLVIATAGDADFLFPSLTFTGAGRAVSDLVFDKLAEIGPEM